MCNKEKYFRGRDEGGGSAHLTTALGGFVLCPRNVISLNIFLFSTDLVDTYGTSYMALHLVARVCLVSTVQSCIFQSAILTFKFFISCVFIFLLAVLTTEIRHFKTLRLTFVTDNLLI